MKVNGVLSFTSLFITIRYKCRTKKAETEKKAGMILSPIFMLRLLQTMVLAISCHCSVKHTREENSSSSNSELKRCQELLERKQCKLQPFEKTKRLREIC